MSVVGLVGLWAKFPKEPEDYNCPEALSGPCRKRRGLQIV